MNLIWKIIARICAAPFVRRWLIAQAMKRPYLHIGGYMHRYWLVPIYWRLPFAIRIHHILRADADPYLHDHPWDWRTIVLDGWYVEEDVFGNLKRRHEGETRGATAETQHRIDQVSSGGVWTLFIMGRIRNRWGFVVGDPARKIYYQDYHSRNGRGDLTTKANS